MDKRVEVKGGKGGKVGRKENTHKKGERKEHVLERNEESRECKGKKRQVKLRGGTRRVKMNKEKKEEENHAEEKEK